MFARINKLVRDNWVVYRYRQDDHESVVHITRREPLIVLVTLLVLMAILPSRVWTVGFVGLALAILLSLVWAVESARQVHFERQLLHAWVQVGDRMEEVFTLHNDSILPVLAAEIEDRSDLPGYHGEIDDKGAM